MNQLIKRGDYCNADHFLITHHMVHHQTDFSKIFPRGISCKIWAMAMHHHCLSCHRGHACNVHAHTAHPARHIIKIMKIHPLNIHIL